MGLRRYTGEVLGEALGEWRQWGREGRQREMYWVRCWVRYQGLERNWVRYFCVRQREWVRCWVRYWVSTLSAFSLYLPLVPFLRGLVPPANRPTCPLAQDIAFMNGKNDLQWELQAAGRILCTCALVCVCVRVQQLSCAVYNEVS